MRGLIALIVALVPLTLHPLVLQAQDNDTAFRNGLSAFQTGSYDRARPAWGALAEAGDAPAQAGLGYMYYVGRGVSRDSARAAELFQRPAHHGEPAPQALLAVMPLPAGGLPAHRPPALL